ncbi:MAG TPA: NAD(P)/FAD-dependent oxidoreductase [Pseudonocardiaceae bacterium]|jgi:NADH dehydrogenase|nr:NAD(P)/FAD-dependent oxidoreductase [Pseudonocardiaceae bacterium]
MRTLVTRVRGFYGEHPLHLIVLLGCFALTGYVAMHVATYALWPRVLIWFLGAVVAHDFVLFPVYALLDRSATSLLDVLRTHRRDGITPRVPVVNYLRIPALGTGLTLVLFLPGIIQQGEPEYMLATGQTQAPYLQRWLLLCAAMFLVSAVVYAIRLYVAGGPVRVGLRPARALFEPGERVLAFAAGPNTTVGAVASGLAFYGPGRDGAGWTRTPWPLVHDVEWDSSAAMLVLHPTDERVALTEPAHLVRVARELIAEPTPPSRPRRRTRIGPVPAGAIAGLLAGIVVGAVTEYHGMLAPGAASGLGLLGYAVQAVLVGLVIGACVTRERTGPAVVVGGAVLLGGLGWLLFPLTLAPLLHGHAPTWGIDAAVAAYPDLVRDVLHGGLVGVLLWAALASGVLRPAARRHRKAVRGARVVIVGGGFAGVGAAQRFERLAVRGAPIDVTVISNSNFLLFTPMLAEAAAGALDARHISVPVRSAASHTRFRYGTVHRIDPQQRLVHLDNTTEPIPYDHLLLTTGSVPHTFGLSGVDEHALTLKDLTDATRLRNHVLEVLENAEHEPDPLRRAAALTFVVAGAGFAGTEMVAELFDLVHGVARFYPGISQSEPRFVIVHAGDRVLPELSAELGRYAHGRLAARGIDCRLGVRVTEATDDGVRLDDGDWIPTRTLVWTAGNRPSPLAAELAATSGESTLTTDATLRVLGIDRVWAAGDCARIPAPGQEDSYYPPTAQHASRQGKAVADNIVAAVTGREPRPFTFDTLGVLVALGRHTAVGDIRGRQFAGLAAWLIWRGVYLSKLPGMEKRLRVLLDWLLDLVFSRDIVVTTPKATDPAPQPETTAGHR